MKDGETMGGIFLSGGSGIGKTTFCHKMNSTYNIALVIDVIRNLNKKNPEISSLPSNERQLIYAIEYLQVHQTNFVSYFLSDRSLLNVLAFWNLDPRVVLHIDFEGRKPDLMVLIPVAPLNWYQSHISYFNDPIRVNTYKDRAGLTREIRLEDELPYLFYKQDLEMYNLMVTMCDYLQWKTFIPAIDPEDFQSSWQKEVENEILNLWYN